MKYDELHSDTAVLAELGGRVAQVRIGLNLTQAELAREAGVGKRTLERLEAGEPTQSPTLIRVLRALGLLSNLELLVPEAVPRPREFVREQRGRPQRASKPAPNPPKGGTWTWGDEG